MCGHDLEDVFFGRVERERHAVRVKHPPGTTHERRGEYLAVGDAPLARQSQCRTDEAPDGGFALFSPDAAQAKPDNRGTGSQHLCGVRPIRVHDDDGGLVIVDPDDGRDLGTLDTAHDIPVR
jgi:hypothetical protein